MFHIRLIESTDYLAVLEVYKPYVEKTAYTFEYVPPTPEEFLKKIVTITSKYPWLVCEYNGKIVGYSYGSTHRDRTAYQWSPESTIYVDENYHGSGISGILYEALFEMLKLQGFFNVYAGVLLSNEKSCRFHERMGFHQIGIFKNIGYKLGSWHSNMWYELHLSEHIHEPPFPKWVGDIKDMPEFRAIIERANIEARSISHSNHLY